MSKGNVWVQKELGGQGQSTQSHGLWTRGWILFWKQWMLERHVEPVWVLGKLNPIMTLDSQGRFRP